MTTKKKVDWEVDVAVREIPKEIPQEAEEPTTPQRIEEAERVPA